LSVLEGNQEITKEALKTELEKAINDFKEE